MQGGQGSLAVRTEGSGALGAVRVINLLRGTVFWFRVDSAVPGLPAVVQRAQQRGLQQGVIKQEVSAAVACSLPLVLLAPSTLAWLWLQADPTLCFASLQDSRCYVLNKSRDVRHVGTGWYEKSWFF